MSRTPQEIAVEMLSTGLTQHQLSLLVELQSAYASVGRQSSDIADIRRERDREYRRNKRENERKNKASAKANDVAAASDLSSDSRPTVADTSCNLSSLLPLNGTKEVKRTSEEARKKNTASVVEGPKPQRGTRLPPDAQLTLSDLDFALSLGMTEENARKLWAEFVDYWIGVPGSRGTKLNWSSTWRNRVRAVTGNDGKPGASNAKTSGIVGAQQKLIGRLAELNRPAPTVGASAIRGGEGGSPVRLISKG